MALGVAALTTLAFACASIIGIEDRLPDDGSDEAGAGIDRVVPVDDVGPGACPSTAKCVSVPDGWVLASLDPSNRPGCAPGYGAPEDIVVAEDGLGCTCTCTETSPGSCGAGGATVSVRGYSATGCGSSLSSATLSVFDGGCGDPILFTSQVSDRLAPAAAAAPTCEAGAGPTPLKNGRACIAQGAGCANGGTCAAELPDAGRLCIEKDGDEACPMAFQKKYIVGSAAGTDTRKCGSCTCTPGTECDAPVLTLYADAGCTGAKLALKADGNCYPQEAGVDASFGSYRYAGKPPGCQPSVPPLLDGGVTITTQRTLCCEQRN